MNHTTVRLATICSVLVLGAFAIALAQHDARNRPREAQPIPKMVSQKAEPIAVDELRANWLQREPNLISHKTVVRANDGQSNPEQPSDNGESFSNPLRSAFDSQLDPSASFVVPASGTEPLPSPVLPTSSPSISLPNATLPITAGSNTPKAASPNLPAGSRPLQPLLAAPPAWLSGSEPANSTTAPRELPRIEAPTLPSGTALPSTSKISDQLSQRTEPIATPPRFPIGGSTNAQAPPITGSSGSGTPIAPSLPIGREPARPTGTIGPPIAGAAPSLPSAGPTQPSSSRSFSDTQQPPMIPTDLGPPSSGFMQSSPALPNSVPSIQPRGAVPPNSPLQPSPTFPQTDRDGGSNALSPRGPASLANSAMNQNAQATLASLVSNEPGNRYLDGSQNGNMLIQKRAPEEIQVGRKAPFVITVRNAGNATAHEVMVVDRVPKGAEFAESNPPVSPSADGLLVWMLGEMAAGDERTINLQIVPKTQGEIGSVAKVYSAAQASVRTIATLPKLEISHVAQPESLIGGKYDIRVTINNTGTGVARNVRLEADLPALVRHDSGEAHLETLIDQLPPNGSVTIPLSCIATEPGAGQCVIRAVTDDGLNVEHAIDLRVHAPALQATIVGPTRRYVERQATYVVKIQNTGSAAATNCDFIMRLPSGLKFNSANNYGSYDPAQHAVFWSLPDLPAANTAVIEVTVLPVETGSQVLSFQGTADLGAKAEAKGQLVVEGQAELAFTIEEDNDPIETTASTTYSVQVSNTGSRPDQDVRLVVQIPAGAQVLNVNSSGQYELRGDQLHFEPLAQMDGKDQRIFRIEVKHSKPGIQVLRFQLTSKNRPVPVVKEEGTLVYDDRSQ